MGLQRLIHCVNNELRDPEQCEGKQCAYDAKNEPQRDYPPARIPNDFQNRGNVAERLQALPPATPETLLLRHSVLYASLKLLYLSGMLPRVNLNNIIRDQRCCHQAKGLFYSELRFGSLGIASFPVCAARKFSEASALALRFPQITPYVRRSPYYSRDGRFNPRLDPQN